jgi:LysR family glycine cleavage system transcriptional activator
MAIARRLPPLNAVRAFEVAARHSGFTLAAKELHVSQGAVSRQIANLEAYLDVKLFDRQLREVRLTWEGARYAEAIASALEQIETATKQLKAKASKRPLRIRIFPTMGIHWLVPRLGRFHAQHREVDVQITTSMEPAVLERDDVDFTVSFAPSDRAGTRSDPLFDVEIIPVCSPTVRDGPPGIRTPDDLLRQLLLHPLNRPNDWARWLEGVGIAAPKLNGGLQFGNSCLLYQSAVENTGVAIAQYRFVEDELVSGRLVAPFPQRVRTGESLYLTSFQNSTTTSAALAFRDWMLAEAHQAPALAN